MQANKLDGCQSNLFLTLLTFLSINLGIAFKIPWIFYVNVAKILNQQCISFSTAQTFSIPRQTLFQKISNIDDSILPQS